MQVQKKVLIALMTILSFNSGSMLAMKKKKKKVAPKKTAVLFTDPSAPQQIENVLIEAQKFLHHINNTKRNITVQSNTSSLGSKALTLLPASYPIIEGLKKGTIPSKASLTIATVCTVLGFAWWWKNKKIQKNLRVKKVENEKMYYEKLSDLEVKFTNIVGVTTTEHRRKRNAQLDCLLQNFPCKATIKQTLTADQEHGKLKNLFSKYKIPQFFNTNEVLFQFLKTNGLAIRKRFQFFENKHKNPPKKKR